MVGWERSVLWAEQNAAADILRKHGLTGTFYSNSGAVGTSGYFTHGDLRRLVPSGVTSAGTRYRIGISPRSRTYGDSYLTCIDR